MTGPIGLPAFIMEKQTAPNTSLGAVIFNDRVITRDCAFLGSSCAKNTSRIPGTLP